ncbi:MAG: ABC transporter ATP-binding protein/permease [Thermomicrobiales bacterium]|nr:ABC transporter ATP-binding protein/permease [Thermomicrobiales bacterium]
MRVIWRILLYLKPYRGRLVFAYLALFIGTGAQLLVPRLVQRVIDEGIVKSDQSAILTGAGMIIGVVAIQAVFTYVRSYLFQAMAETVSTDIRHQLYGHLLKLPFQYFDVAQSGQLMSRATEDVNAIRRFLMFSLRMVIYAVTMFVIVSFLLLREHFTLGIISLAVMPILAFTAVYFSINIRPMFARIQQEFGEMSSVMQENLAGTRVVRVFAREDSEIRKFDHSLDVLYDRQIDAIRYYSFFFPFMQFLSGLSLGLILWYGGRQVLNGSLSIGTFVAFNLYLTLLANPLRQLGWIMNSVARAIASGDRIFEVIDTRPAIRNKDGAAPLESPRGDVAFADVSFTYPHTARPAIRDVTFSASSGAVIGLIGSTGSGKSTVTNLLARFYEISRGSITFDGIDVRDIELASLRRNIGFVLQETFLFSSTIRDNIAFGNPNATIEEVEQAARIAQAYDFISAMPDGFDSQLGERGVSLSGGQRQRVAIARAICSDPRILVFDDATSSVDTETEFQIQQALNNAMAGRTTFIIAQRVSSLKDADEILVFDEGAIVERGKHQHLITQGGHYARLYELQLKDQEEFVTAAD